MTNAPLRRAGRSGDDTAVRRLGDYPTRTRRVRIDEGTGWAIYAWRWSL